MPLDAGTITAGPDGNIWFGDLGANAIGMINPTTHAISLFTLPSGSGGAGAVTLGPDGNIWFSEQGAECDRDYQPRDSRYQLIQPTIGHSRLREHHDWPRRQPLVHLQQRPQDRKVQSDDSRRERVHTLSVLLLGPH